MVTTEKDLHFGNPLWDSKPSRQLPVDVLKKDISTDILIIGAGISGALMADELSEAGFKVVLVDKRYPGHGSTMATTALLQFEIDQPLSHMIRQIGFEKAVRAWRRSKLCLECLAIRTKTSGIRCGLHLQESVYLSGNTLNVHELQKELLLRNQIGLQSAFADRRFLLDNYGIKAQAALRSYHNYTAHPYHLCIGFLQKAIERGAKVFSPVAISEVVTSPRRVYLQTSCGFNIKARYAVFTTGYEAPAQLSNQRFKIYSTWAIATRKQKSAITRQLPLVWEASDPYLYLRTTSDGRIICGGEDEPISDEEKRNMLNLSKTKSLQKKLKALVPSIDSTAAFSWSGAFGITPTGLPLIGQVPGLNNCFSVMAFGGNGITWSRLGAEMVRNFITGKKEVDEDLFGFIT